MHYNNMLQQSAKERYETLKQHREHFLDRGQECSELTIPSLLPPDGFHSSTDLYNPFQSVGARGVNNLASKLLLLLLPPNSPFFRLSVSGNAKRDLDQQKEIKSEVEKSLATIEREVSSKIEQLALRVSVFEALKHLIVAGNVLTYLPKKGTMRVFPLTNFVCKRDASGNIIEIVIEETIHPTYLDGDTLERISQFEDYKPDEECELYTHIYKLNDKEFYTCQEVKGVKIESSQGTYPIDSLPYQALRMVRVDNEDYGRGYVEEFLGDLKSLEGLSQALVESAAASSKVVFMVRPNSVTRKKDLANTRNGDIITGSADDVAVLQAQKQYDLQVVERSIAKLEERLSYAFLLNTAIQRDAERVTAQEIRYMAQQLETAMGGIYSLLSQEFQLPLVTILMKRMSQANEIPSLPKNSVKPTIITGVEALGRGNDLQKLREFVAEIANLAQVNPAVVQSLNTQDLIKRIATGLGIDTEGLVKSDEELAQEQAAQEDAMQNQQMMQLAEKAVAPAVQGAMKQSQEG
ncbi:head-to-tail joining protein [Pelagibacter phage HTVC142P]|nr:head-to-tail joining protein [Pelagibacter phage HTVC142P]